MWYPVVDLEITLSHIGKLQYTLHGGIYLVSIVEDVPKIYSNNAYMPGGTNK
jgi:hypothetical protein